MKKLLALLFVLGLAIAGTVWWFATPKKPAVSETLFKFTELKKGEMQERVSATGRLKPLRVVYVFSETPGVVVRVLGEVNQEVSAGDVLLRLDDKLAKLKVAEASDGVKTAEAAVRHAEAQKSAAQRALNYQRDLETRGGFRGERIKAEAALDAATAALPVVEAKLDAAKTLKKQAEYALQRCVVRVPDTAGANAEHWHVVEQKKPYPPNSPSPERLIILQSNVRVGQLAGPSAQATQPLFLLGSSLHQMEIQTEVLEGDVGKLQANLDAVFSINSSADPDREFPAKVREIRHMANNIRGSAFFTTILDVANEKNPTTQEWQLRPGMTAAVDIIVRRHKDAWKVPIPALTFRMEKEYQTVAAKKRLEQWQDREDKDDWTPVWLWQGNKTRVWPIFVRLANSKTKQTGIQNDDYQEVLEWEAGVTPREGMRFIISAPPAKEPGLLDQPLNFKVS